MNYPLKNSPSGSGLRGGSRSPGNSRNGLNGRSRNRYKKPLQIAAAILILLVVFRLAAPHAFDSFFAAAFAPLWHMENSVSADDFFATHAALVAENARLTDELAALAPAESAEAALEQENAELKALLGRTISGSNLTLAAVLETPPSAAYDSLIIDLGSDKNVKAGDRVFALASPLDFGPDSASSTGSSAIASSTASTTATASTTGQVLVPIGSIAETFAGTSKVELFSSPGQKYQVEIGPDHIPATAVSRGGGDFSAQIAQGSDVQVGDPVIVPDIETLTFGTVGAVENDPSQPYINVLWSEPVNIFQLRWVLVADQ